MDWRGRRYFTVMTSPSKDYEMQIQLIKAIPSIRMHPRAWAAGDEAERRRGVLGYYQFLVGCPDTIADDVKRFIDNLVSGVNGGFCREILRK